MRFVFPHAPVRPVTINGGRAMRAWYDLLQTDLVQRETMPAWWATDVGWRIDYELATPGIAARACRPDIHLEPRFSDHAPLTIDCDLTLRHVSCGTGHQLSMNSHWNAADTGRRWGISPGRWWK